MLERGLTTCQATVKRAIDLVAAIIGLTVAGPLILAAALASRLEIGESGIYVQQRIGRDGEPFPLLKVRTMRSDGSTATTVTVRGDNRITRVGAFLRRYKLDELPQLVNVLVGDMSLVGPRPDVHGFADQLVGQDRLLLSIRPGITGPAALAYRHEERILEEVEDPVSYNREVIWPDKVRINLQYIREYGLRLDASCIFRTLVPQESSRRSVSLVQMSLREASRSVRKIVCGGR